jgi:CheY-like chemotaxis protein
LSSQDYSCKKILNEVVVAQDDVEGLDYLFGRNAYSGRDASVLPAFILLDLKLPRMDGLEALHHIRCEEKKELLPMVILTSSRGDQDRMNDYKNG